MIKLVDLLNIIGWQQVINLDEGTLDNNRRIGRRTCEVWLTSPDLPNANVQAVQVDKTDCSICVLLTRISLDSVINDYLTVLSAVKHLAGPRGGMIDAPSPQNAPTGELEAKNDKEEGE